MPITSRAELVEALSGDTQKGLPYAPASKEEAVALLVECADKACLFGEPDISADSDVQYKSGEFLKNTPLSLILNIHWYYRKNERYEKQHDLLIDSIKKLLHAGASIFIPIADRNFVNPIEPTQLTSGFESLLSSITREDVYEALPAKQLAQNSSSFIHAFLDLSMQRFASSMNLLVLCLNKLHQEAGEIEGPDFFKLMGKIVFTVSTQDNATLRALHPKLMDVLDPFLDEYSNGALFKQYLRYKQGHHWLAKFPASNTSNEQQAYLMALPQKEFEHRLLWLLDKGRGFFLFRLNDFNVQGYDTRETWENLTKKVAMGGWVVQKQAPIRKKLGHQPDLKLHALLAQDDLSFHDLLGRTLLLKNNQGTYFALKVQKEEEDDKPLSEEYLTVQWLNEEKQQYERRLKSQLGRADIAKALSADQQIYRLLDQYPPLKSQLPQALDCGFFDEPELQALVARFIPEDHEKRALFFNMIKKKGPIQYYLYQAPSSYFTYLHDPALSDAEFQAASDASFYDLAKLLKERAMVYHQLGDIFHNTTNSGHRTDGGRYLVLAPLVRTNKIVVQSGRIDQWQNSVQYVNLRASGLADLGDFQFFDQYCQAPFFQEIRQMGQAETPYTNNLIYANVLAEYLLIFTLVCGKRALALRDRLPEEEYSALWVSLATELLNKAVLLIHEFNGISKVEAHRYIRSVFNPEICARQMRFWMTPDYAATLSGKFNTYEQQLAELYPGARVYPSRAFKNLKEGIGFSNTPPFQDLGDYNCQNPMKEDNKLYYFVPTLSLLLQYAATQYRNATYDFEERIAARDYKKAVVALCLMITHRYPHSTWQRGHIERCKQQLMVQEEGMAVEEEVPVVAVRVQKYRPHFLVALGAENAAQKEASGVEPVVMAQP